MIVAVLGPSDLVERVTALGKSFKNLTFIPYPYRNERETLSILQECAVKCDMALFTGPIPYGIARQESNVRLPMFYVSYSSGALHVLLLSHIEAYGRRKGDPFRMSIDTLEAESVQGMLREFGGSWKGAYVYEAGTAPTEADLVSYHHGLYQQGKTDFAVTGLTSAYHHLCALGVPTYRLTITDSAIRVAIGLVEMQAHILAQRDYAGASLLTDGPEPRTSGAPAEPFGELAPTALDEWSEEPWVLALSEASKVSLHVLVKIAQAASGEKDGAFSANDVADVMGTTLHHARRIVARLEDAGGITCIKKENPPGAGRPRRVFRFVMDEPGDGKRSGFLSGRLEKASQDKGRYADGSRASGTTPGSGV